MITRSSNASEINVIYLESVKQFPFSGLTHGRTKHLMIAPTKKNKQKNNKFDFILNFNEKSIIFTKGCTPFDLAKRISGALPQNNQ